MGNAIEVMLMGPASSEAAITKVVGVTHAAFVTGANYWIHLADSTPARRNFKILLRQTTEHYLL